MLVLNCDTMRYAGQSNIHFGFIEGGVNNAPYQIPGGPTYQIPAGPSYQIIGGSSYQRASHVFEQRTALTKTISNAI